MSAINELIMLTFLPPVSCLDTTRDGSTAEMALVGNDGTIGIASFLGCGTISHRAVAQIVGHALKIPAQALQDVRPEGSGIDLALFLQYFSLPTDYGRRVSAKGSLGLL
jgi:hypothetical protein